MYLSDRLLVLTLLSGLGSSVHHSLEPDVELFQPKGLLFKYTDVPLTERVQVTYDIQQVETQGDKTTRSSKYTGTTTLKSVDGHWYYENLNVDVTLGSTIRYVIKYLGHDDMYEYEGFKHFPAYAVAPVGQRLTRRGTTVFYDDFSSGHLDTTKWRQEITAWGGGNGEFQMYTPEAANTFVRNGILYLKPTFTSDKFGENFLHHGTLDIRQTWGVCTSNNENGCHRQGSQNNIPPIMSSKMISTSSITYGRVEVVAKISKGDWIWPAIWMLPPGGPWKYGGWPRSGEIDIMESRGNADLKDSQGNANGADVVLSTIHWGADSGQHRQAGHWRKSSPGSLWSDNFHTYSLDWTAHHIRMDIDNQPVFAWNTPSQGYWSYSRFSGNNIWSSGGQAAPFDSKMSLILNVAVGGSRGYFPDGWLAPDGKPWRNTSPTAIMDFWRNRHQWQGTWQGDDVAMKIRSVKMVQY